MYSFKDVLYVPECIHDVPCTSPVKVWRCRANSGMLSVMWLFRLTGDYAWSRVISRPQVKSVNHCALPTWPH